MLEDDALAGHLTAISAYIDASYAPDLAPEAVEWRRTAKVVEEVGEAFGAFIGLIGENPRKGITHTEADLLMELADVALSALGAIEHRTGNRGHAMSVLGARAEFCARRLGLTPEPNPCGHATTQRGCGGCDPGAVEWVIEDGGTWRHPTADDFSSPITADDIERILGNPLRPGRPTH